MLGVKSNNRSKRRLLSKQRVFKSRKRTVRFSILSANIILLLVVVGFVTKTPTNGAVTAQNNALLSENSQVASPLDQLSSADIAVHVARMAGLDETVSVVNHADSVNAQLAVAPVDEVVAPKPQIVTSALKSKKDIDVYIVKEGDTLTSVANEFGVTSDSIRWSNGLTGEGLTVGGEIHIPPVNGIVYKVKDGDTVDAISERFSADKQKLIEMNDAEIAGLVKDDYIIIPDGVQPVRSPAYTTSFYGARTLSYGPGNGYDYGWCTWHAANRRREIGRPIPTNLGNAITWYGLAQRGGHATGTEPQAGAVLWHANLGGLGHVAFVESVNPDGSFEVSDMNYPIWGTVTYRTVSASEKGNYRFIY